MTMGMLGNYIIYNIFINGLIEKAKRIADEEHLKGEMATLKQVFIQNGYVPR